jgi:hypothetical protein
MTNQLFIMKKLTIIFLLTSNAVFAQFGVSAHQSDIPFVGFNYEFSQHLRPELRIGTDNYFELVSIELVATYDILDEEDYEFYAGAGARFNLYGGMVVPVGLNIFPFSNKSFGFHIELSPIISFDDESLLRGSWGIRYRFLN